MTIDRETAGVMRSLSLGCLVHDQGTRSLQAGGSGMRATTRGEAHIVYEARTKGVEVKATLYDGTGDVLRWEVTWAELDAAYARVPASTKHEIDAIRRQLTDLALKGREIVHRPGDTPEQADAKYAASHALFERSRPLRDRLKELEASMWDHMSRPEPEQLTLI